MNEHELRNLMYSAQLPGHGSYVIRYPRGKGVLVDWRNPMEESFQYSLVPVKLVIRNVVTPKNTVQAILPVRLPPPGGNGTIPMMFATKIKKKQVSNHGAYFGASLPRVGKSLRTSFISWNLKKFYIKGGEL